jgi:hypothetical protein
VKITTYSGRALLDVEVEHGTDRAWFAVAGFGVVTVRWSDPSTLEVILGRWEDQRCPAEISQFLPGQPAPYGIAVYGSPRVRVRGGRVGDGWDVDTESHLFRVKRLDSHRIAPVGTCRRATDVGLACARDFLARPTAHLMLRARQLAEAPSRLAAARRSLTVALDRLNLAGAEVSSARAEVERWEVMAAQAAGR